LTLPLRRGSSLVSGAKLILDLAQGGWAMKIESRAQEQTPKIRAGERRLPTVTLAQPTKTDCGDGTCGCGCGLPQSRPER